ncbi:MAG: glycosyltransferase family 4 protein [Candidatus Paceibacterota bacterium]
MNKPSPQQCSHVVWIVPALDFGGVETVCQESAPMLRRRGVRVTVINLGTEGRAARALAAQGTTVHTLDGSIRPYSLNTIRRIRAVLRAARPSLVHCRVVEANWLGGLAALSLGIPFVVEEVGVPRGRSWLGNWLRRMLYARADRVISVSRTTQAWFEERGYFSGPDGRTRGVVLSNPVDHTVYDRRYAAPESPSPRSMQPFPADRGAVVIGTVCRLAEEKGIDVLLAAASILRAKLDALDTHEQIEIRIVGDGPLRNALESQARALKGSPVRVVWAGYAETVADWLCTFDIFVLPSRTEGTSRSLLEAMASGVACVGTAVGDTPGLLADGRGVCVGSEDPAALAVALRSLSIDPDRRRSLASRAARFVREQYSPDAYIQHVISLYDRVVT